MGYEYEKDILELLKDIEKERSLDLSKEINEIQGTYQTARLIDNIAATTKKRLTEQERKAKAFDNYMVDLTMAIQTYRNDYDKHRKFRKETYDYYMQSKEKFIESYNNVDRHHETIDSVEEYDKIISDLERADDGV